MSMLMEEIESFLPEVSGLVRSGEYDFARSATALDRCGPYHKRDVVAAGLAFDVDLGRMARALNRSRGGLKRYVNANLDVVTFFSDLTESVLDEIEGNVLGAARGGDLAMCRFVLTTMGRSRGWTTRGDVLGDGGGEVVVDKSPVDRLKAMVGAAGRRGGGLELVGGSDVKLSDEG